MRRFSQTTEEEKQFFFEQIGHYNARHEQGTTHLVNMGDDKAMMIFWGKFGWDCAVYDLEDAQFQYPRGGKK